MVKRYPHKAIIKVQIPGRVVDGEWVEGSDSIVEIEGRYDPVDTNNVFRLNSLGNEVQVRGEFYTLHEKIEGAVSIEIKSLGISKSIVNWWPFQTHNVIYV